MAVDIDLQGRTAFVTGAGSGIGRRTAILLAEAGTAVAVADIAEKTARDTAAAIAELGATGVPITVDVADWESCLAAASEATEALGSIDVLVNGAAVWTIAKFVDLDPTSWARDIDIGFKGTLQMTRAILPQMKERKRGVVVNIASDAGRTGEALHVVYSAAKAGVIGFTKALAREMGRHGVRVNAVCPGATRTPSSAGVVDGWSDDTIRAMYPLGRIGEPIDIASAVLYFASDLSSWVTGQILSVSGGYSTVG